MQLALDVLGQGHMRVPPRGVSHSDVHVYLLCEPVAEDSAGAEVVVSAHAKHTTSACQGSSTIIGGGASRAHA
jgi:hypothetical protein